MFYTNDHEWIDFHGITAYVGISNIKLSGFKEIHELNFDQFFSYKKRGEVIARIKYLDYQVEVHMPTDGSIIQVNKLLTLDDLDQIATHLNTNGWIFSIIPSNPYDRTGLMTAKKYLESKNNFEPKKHK
jgi:glycine cleavage system H protein